MKKWMSILLSLSLGLAMTACANEQVPAEDLEPPVVQSPYWFEMETTADKFSDDEGNLLASYSYQVAVMKVGDDGDGDAVRMAENFNAGMREVLDSRLEIGNELGQWASYDEGLRESDTHYTDELTAEGFQMGSIYTVSFESYYYAGGAHPNRAYETRTFDLERGEFIDPLEISDDPEQFRATVTDLILDQIQHLDPDIQVGFFEGYESTVSQWNTRYVCFHPDGMTVIFSAYDLGPYVMGAQYFDISYEDLTAALGEGGQLKLGLTAPDGGQEAP